MTLSGHSGRARNNRSCRRHWQSGSAHVPQGLPERRPFLLYFVAPLSQRPLQPAPSPPPKAPNAPCSISMSCEVVARALGRVAVWSEVKEQQPAFSQSSGDRGRVPALARGLSR